MGVLSPLFWVRFTFQYCSSSVKIWKESNEKLESNLNAFIFNQEISKYCFSPIWPKTIRNILWFDHEKCNILEDSLTIWKKTKYIYFKNLCIGKIRCAFGSLPHSKQHITKYKLHTWIDLRRTVAMAFISACLQKYLSTSTLMHFCLCLHY